MRRPLAGRRKATVEDSKRPLIGNQPTASNQESTEQLEAMIAGYSRYGAFAEGRKARVKALMERHSAKKWSPAKKARMARRYFTAAQGAEEAAGQVALLRDRLAQLAAA